MKDLSRRNIGVPKSLIPSFAIRAPFVGSIAQTGPIFNPGCACTVLYAVVQVLSATTIQLLENNAPIGAPLTVPANTIIRYPGKLLANNAALGLALTPSAQVNFEVQWLKEFLPEYIFHDLAINSAGSASGIANENIVEWGGATVAAALADAPTGAEIAPVVRRIGRKRTIIETTTPLAANATFTGPWHDSELDGTRYVSISSFSNVASSASGLVVQSTDDLANSNFTKTIYNVQAGANALFDSFGQLAVPVRGRYYRVTYRNGAVAQTSFELAITSVDDLSLPQGASFSGTTQPALPAVLGAGAVTVADNFRTWAQSVTVANAPPPVDVLMYGGAFSGSADKVRQGYSAARTPTVFRQVTATALGNTAIWTPGAGNTFRLLRFRIQVTANTTLAAPGLLTISFQDGGVAPNLLSHIVDLPGAAFTGYDSSWVDLGTFGILSAVANNLLVVNLSAALATGLVNVITGGTEE